MGLPITVGDMEFATFPTTSIGDRDHLSFLGAMESSRVSSWTTSAFRGVGADGWLTSLYSRRCGDHEGHWECACGFGHNLNDGLRSAMIAISPPRSTLRMLVAGMTAAFALVITAHSLGFGVQSWWSQNGPTNDVSSRSRSKSLVVIHDGMGDKTVPMFSAVPDEVQRSTSRSLKIGKTAKADNNNDQGDQADPPGTEILTRRARVGYLVMTSGVEELRKTKRLLEAIYDPSNFYLVHLDRKSGEDARLNLENFIKKWDNVRMLVPALDVSWGGYTITLTAIFGICTMVQWSDEWDFFINLSASDFPLLPQDELREVLGKYADTGMNFVEGAPLNERNRVEVFTDDQGLYRNVQSSRAGRPLKIGKPRPPPSKSMFTVFKGEFWVVLHRSFCQYVEASPDNVARSLQAYFSRFRISDESYFQTVLCHPQAPDFPVYGDNLRFVSWPQVSEGYYVLHPDPITETNVNLALDSGALFARKFDYKVSREAYAILEESLAHRNLLRVGQAATRLFSASRVVDKKVFCQIPEGYSIQEVLSRPPKAPLEKQEARIKAGVRTMEAVEGKANTEP